MNAHERYEEMIVACLYGEAAEAERAELRRHMAECETCAAEVADFEKIREAMGEESGAASMRLSEFTRRRIVARAERARRPAVFTTARLALAAAAVVAAVGAGVLYRTTLERGAPEAQVAQSLEKPDSAPKISYAPVPAGKPEAAYDRARPAVPAPALDRKEAEENLAREGQLVGQAKTAGDRDASGGVKQLPESVAAAPAASAPPQEAPAQQAASGEQVDTQKVGESEYTAGLPASQASPVLSGAVKDESEPRGATLNYQSAAEEESRKRQLANAPETPAKPATAPAVPTGSEKKGKALDDYSQRLGAALRLLSENRRPEAIIALKDLIKRYPARRQEILGSIPDAPARRAIERDDAQNK